MLKEELGISASLKILSPHTTGHKTTYHVRVKQLPNLLNALVVTVILLFPSDCVSGNKHKMMQKCLLTAISNSPSLKHSLTHLQHSLLVLQLFSTSSTCSSLHLQHQSNIQRLLHHICNPLIIFIMSPTLHSALQYTTKCPPTSLQHFPNYYSSPLHASNITLQYKLKSSNINGLVKLQRSKNKL